MLGAASSFHVKKERHGAILGASSTILLVLNLIFRKK